MHDGLGPISDQPMPVTRSVIAKNPWALRPAGVRSASSSTSSLANCTASTWCESCPLVCPLTPVLHVLTGPRRLNHGKQNAKQCYSYHGNFALRIRRLGVRISSGAHLLQYRRPAVKQTAHRCRSLTQEFASTAHGRSSRARPARHRRDTPLPGRSSPGARYRCADAAFMPSPR